MGIKIKNNIYMIVEWTTSCIMMCNDTSCHMYTVSAFHTVLVSGLFFLFKVYIKENEL